MSWDRRLPQGRLCFPYRKEALKVKTKKVEDTLVLCSYSSVHRAGKVDAKTEKKKAEHGFQAVTIVRRKRGFPGWKVKDLAHTKGMLDDGQALKMDKMGLKNSLTHC